MRTRLPPAVLCLLCALALACGRRKRGPTYRAVQVAAAGSTACAAMGDGSVRCWGEGSESTPTIERGFAGAIAVCAGADYTCARTKDGVTCRWKNGKTSDAPGALDVSCETSRRCIADASGAVTCGDTRIADVSGALRLASAGDASCAVLQGGAVRCWGKNADVTGDLAKLEGVADVTIGGHHACARRTDETVWCWGRNDHGQLGDGTTINRATPAPVENLAGIQHVAAGALHTCAHRGDDTIRCWGDGARHQLGLGATTLGALTPTLVSGLYEAVGIAAGDYFTCARMTDGWIRCWGANEAGQVGDGTSLERAVPVPIRM